MKQKIKEELLKELNGNIDQLYDFIDRHFLLSKENDDYAVQYLNRLKNELYTIINESKLL